MTSATLQAQPDKALEAELRRFASNCRKEVGYFQREALSQRLWAGQLQIVQSLRDHRQTLVESAHGVGKTHCLAGLIPEIVCCPESFNPEFPAGGTVRVVATASTNKQIYDVLWTELKAQVAKAVMPIGGRILETGTWEVTADRRVTAISVGDPTAMQGKHASLVVVIVDEAEGVDLETWQALFSLMSGPHDRILAVNNPTKSTGFLAEQTRRPDLWNIIRMDALDHPNVVEGRLVIPGAVSRSWIINTIERECGATLSELPWDEVEARIRSGEFDDDPVVCARVRGKRPKGATWQIITGDSLEACAESFQPPAAEGKHMGVDVATSGADKSVITVTDEQRRVVAVVGFHGHDEVTVGEQVIEVAEKHQVHQEHIHIEKDGVGGGVISYLRRVRGWNVDAVVMGGGPVGDWPGEGGVEGVEFKNRRAELWWVARRILLARAAQIGRQYAMTWADLMAPTYSRDEKGRIVVESKEAIRKKLGRSPDFGDSWVLSLSRGGGPELMPCLLNF